MELINGVRAKFGRDEFEFSRRATDQSILRNISGREIRETVAAGEIIESYPDDKYGLSHLELGFTRVRRPIHLQCSYPARPILKVVTLYEPDPAKWTDDRVRRVER